MAEILFSLQCNTLQQSLDMRHLDLFIVSNLQSKKIFFLLPLLPNRGLSPPPCDPFHAFFFKQKYQIVKHFNHSMSW